MPSPEASQPMPIPASPPPGATLQKPGRGRRPKPADTTKTVDAVKQPDVTKQAGVSKRANEPRAEPTPKSTGTNDLLSFLTFVEHHRPGSSVNAIVENYSSHGAYVRIGEVKGYVPLSLMADPAPRSAREFMKIGESITLVVESFAPTRRSIDLAIPTMATIKVLPVEAPVETKPKRARKKAAAKQPTAIEPTPVVDVEAPPAPRKRVSKKAAAAAVPEVAPKPRAKKAAVAAAPVEEPTAKPVKKRATKKAPAAAEPSIESNAPAKPTRRRSKSV
jgi:hypothetical protein